LINSKEKINFNFKVSVIIPVFNAEKYIEEAIYSAIDLDETGEIIAIDDGSTDMSLSILQKLRTKHSKLIILQHPDKNNKGRSKSRNLGIKNASFEYISFLDADDLYLPNRFKIEKDIFQDYPKVDGVYGATKAIFENPTAEELYFQRFDYSLTTIKKGVYPELLLQALLFGGYGHFTTDAITLRKSVLSRTGLFNEKLHLKEDTHLWYRAAAVGNLVEGNIQEPIALRRVHTTNSIHSNEEIHRNYYNLMLEDLIQWALNNKNLSFDQKNLFFMALNTFVYPNMKSSVFLCKFLQKKANVRYFKFGLRKIIQLVLV